MHRIVVSWVWRFAFIVLPQGVSGFALASYVEAMIGGIVWIFARGRAMRETAEREARENEVFFTREREGERLRRQYDGKYFGIQGGGLVVVGETRAEVLDILQPDRHYFEGCFHFRLQWEPEAYRSVVLEAFRDILRSKEACVFWQTFATQVRKKNSLERRHQLVGTLAHAFLLPYVSMEDEEGPPPITDSRFVKGKREPMLTARRRKQMLTAAKCMAPYGLGLVPLLSTKEAVSQWLLSALHMYVQRRANGTLGQRYSDEDLEDYRLGLA